MAEAVLVHVVARRTNATWYRGTLDELLLVTPWLAHKINHFDNALVDANAIVEILHERDSVIVAVKETLHDLCNLVDARMLA